jgi:hypothetical protein
VEDNAGSGDDSNDSNRSIAATTTMTATPRDEGNGETTATSAGTTPRAHPFLSRRAVKENGKKDGAKRHSAKRRKTTR